MSDETHWIDRTANNLDPMQSEFGGVFALVACVACVMIGLAWICMQVSSCVHPVPVPIAAPAPVPVMIAKKNPETLSHLAGRKSRGMLWEFTKGVVGLDSTVPQKKN